MNLTNNMLWTVPFLAISIWIATILVVALLTTTLLTATILIPILLITTFLGAMLLTVLLLASTLCKEMFQKRQEQKQIKKYVRRPIKQR